MAEPDISLTIVILVGEKEERGFLSSSEIRSRALTTQMGSRQAAHGRWTPKLLLLSTCQHTLELCFLNPILVGGCKARHHFLMKSLLYWLNTQLALLEVQ